MGKKPDCSTQAHTHTHTQTHLDLIPNIVGLPQEQHVLKNTRIVLPL